MTSNVMTQLDKLNLTDRFLFKETMEDLASYQATVSILMENEIIFKERPETEKEMSVSPELRGIRLDVVDMDRGGKLYYTEMQKKNTGNLRKRSRYYQSQMDVSLLEPGSTDFNRLNDSCLILVAPFDIFGKGLYRYTFEGSCKEYPELKIEDGAVRIFINTKGKNRKDFSQEFLDFMEYITKSTDEVAAKTESERIKLIHRRVRRIRASEKMGVKYMQEWEELAYAKEEGISEGYQRGKDDGVSEGKDQQLIQMVCKKIYKGKSPAIIAQELEESEETVRKICDAAKEFAPEYDCEKIYDKIVNMA